MTHIQVLGPGCTRCNILFERAEQAAAALGIEYEIEKVTDINEILNFGVMMTPALAVDGEIKVVGKAASVDELKKLIK